MVKMIRTLALTLIAGISMTLATAIYTDSEAGKRKIERIYTLQEIVDRLYETGHYNIRVTDSKPPYYDFDVCRGGREYELTIDHKGNIRDRDDEGRCRKARKSDRYKKRGKVAFDKGVRVRAPFVKVDIDERGVRVKAPGTDVKVR